MYVLEKNDCVTVMTRSNIEWLTGRNFYNALDYLEYQSGIQVTPLKQYLKPSLMKYLRAVLTASASNRPKMTDNEKTVIEQVINMKGCLK